MTPQNTHPTIPFRTEPEQRAALERVVRHLRAGGLIAYPTETVYGFGCTLQADALSRLAAIKRRGFDSPFLLLVTDRHMFANAAWTPAAIALASAFWPGPLTLALRTTGGQVPREVVSMAGTVALRATPHAGVRMLLERCGPLTSTSANAPDDPPAADARTAAAPLVAGAGGWPVLVLDGGTLPPSRASTIVDCSTEPPRLIRAGEIDATQLSEVIHGIEVTEP
jgi:L-threonylcarbamoyladenylate synthase